MADSLYYVGQRRSTGGWQAGRVDEDTSLATMPSHGRYHDAVLRGRCYAGGTAATGVAPGTAIGTTAGFSLYNPVGSGYHLVVLKVSMGYISGTLGAGTIHYLANNNPAAAATTGTAITVVNCKLGGGNGVGRPLTTATIPAPTILRPFVSLGASLASTAVSPWVVSDDVGGEFVIAPGCTLSLHGTTAAGTTPLVAYGIMWEEQPI